MRGHTRTRVVLVGELLSFYEDVEVEIEDEVEGKTSREKLEDRMC